MSRRRPINGYRSGLELRVAEYLTKIGVKFEFEKHVIEYSRPQKYPCSECGCKLVTKPYTPDFWLPDYGFFIETKGKFLPYDRTKMKCVKQQHPEIDLRIHFMRNNPLKLKTLHSYGDWADAHGYMWHVDKNGIIDPKWLSKRKRGKKQ